MKPIVIDKFDGSNKLEGEALRLIYNYIVTNDKKLKKVPSFVSEVSLAKAHSLFSYSNKVLFLGRDNIDSNDSLYVYDFLSKNLVKLIDFDFKDILTSFVYIEDNYIIISNSQWHGIFNGTNITNVSGTRPPCDNIVFFQSRIIGSKGDTLIFSEPYDYFEMLDINYIRFGDTITAIYPLPMGLLVGTNAETFILGSRSGTDDVFPLPKQTKLSDTDILPNTITKFIFSGKDIYVWATSRGLIFFNGETLIEGSTNKIDYKAEGVGTSLYNPAIGCSGVGLQGASFSDAMDIKVIRDGKLI